MQEVRHNKRLQVLSAFYFNILLTLQALPVTFSLPRHGGIGGHGGYGGWLLVMLMLLVALTPLHANEDGRNSNKRYSDQSVHGYMTEVSISTN